MKHWLGLLGLLLAGIAQAAISVTDGAGNVVTLPQPARRIVSLAPHATELLFAAGAGDRVVATVEYSDHPDAAKKLPRVGGFTGFSLEAVLRQRPDLVVAWRDGGTPRELERLRRMGVPVFISHPLQPGDVALEIGELGRLSGTEATAVRAAAQYRQRLAALQQRYGGRAPVRVFYQLSQTPIFTISGKSYIDALIRICGGVNVFADLPLPAPQVSTASVVAAQPQAILAADEATLAMWRRWGGVPAVAHAALFALPGDAISIPGPRLVEGAAALCERLDAARQRLGLTPN
ncbi:cobalamin-binding protein [Chromobacterium sphagni]|uniref:Cobalamin-binding protein n=1 Tax=Chromobacterium sphagni TaxID=1903179 RepID=A0A1S1WZ36_9NEIS|nr:cobalamin-binding protein [Chromobacterium sphagni]OHX12390.1 cobalamin-binding protein [Chromobacterium sphagni]OHX21525.1 cobalamin-binding protein [Chromobacterium sphagni]